MSIKLYKSQLTPTTNDSNVADRRQINLGEAQSIGKAWKGMVKAGEELYITHQDITNTILSATLRAKLCLVELCFISINIYVYTE